MANCPNCGAELAPSVLSCARCRRPVTYGAPPPQAPPSSPQGQAPQLYAAQPYQPDPGIDPFDDDEGPTERDRRNRRNTITLVSMMAVVLVVGLVAGIVVLTSSLAPDQAEPVPPGAPATSVTPPPPSDAPNSQAPPPATEAPPTSEVPPSTQPPSTQPPTSKPPEVGPTQVARGARWCSDLVAVPKAGTSCEFAAEVADAVAGADPDATEFTVHASSPVTGQDYEMACVRNSVLITCTGGVNATVWIKVGGAP